MKKFFKSIFTDKDWDGDCSKTLGFILIVIGVVGFFLEKNSFQWLIVSGAGMIATGKIAEESTVSEDDTEEVTG